MRKFAICILFIFTALVPTSAWAIPVLDLFHPIISAIQTPIHWISAYANTLTAASTVTKNTYDMADAISAPALAAASPFALTEAQAAIKTAYNTGSINYDMNELYDIQTKPSRSGFKSFWDLAKKVNLVLSGNYGDFGWDTLQQRFRLAFDNFMEQFTTKAIEQSIENFVEDIASCNTPQLDLMLPSFDLDFGFAFCDYSKMFSDMKRQTRALSHRSWGGMLRVNGEDIDELLQDGDGLEDAIKMTSPGVGNTLALDMFSEMSTNASVQASIDSTAMQRQMKTLINRIEKGNIFGDMTPQQRDELRAKADALAAQIQAANAAAANEIATAGVNIMAERGKQEERRDMRDEILNSHTDGASLF